MMVSKQINFLKLVMLTGELSWLMSNRDIGRPTLLTIIGLLHLYWFQCVGSNANRDARCIFGPNSYSL